MGACVQHGRRVLTLPDHGRHDKQAFILANTTLLTPPLVPEIRLHLAEESIALWEKTEEELERLGLPPPFWAFAWAGGQGLARYILDHPHIVAGHSVIDIASGSGLVAIAAMKAGASRVIANDIDEFAACAIALNAEANGVTISSLGDDVIGETIGADIVLVGDLFYERDVASRLLVWMQRLQGAGKTVLIGDPGRSYLPVEALEELARYDVPVTRELEDADIKRCTVWRPLPNRL